MGLELVPQYFYRVSAAPFLYFSRHKCLGIQKIRVYQTGVEHPGKEHRLQKIGEYLLANHRQLNFLPHSAAPAVAWSTRSVLPLKPALERSGIFSLVVSQSGKQSLLFCAKGCGKPGAQVCCPIQMFLDGLLPFIL